ncbi:hypothetical protein D3C86_1994450 [compost metagenome]
MRQGTFILQPAAFGPDGDIAEITLGNNLAQGHARFSLAVLPVIKAGFVAESVFFHYSLSAHHLH